MHNASTDADAASNTDTTAEIAPDRAADRAVSRSSTRLGASRSSGRHPGAALRRMARGSGARLERGLSVGRRHRTVTIAVAVVLVAALVATIWLGILYADQRASEASRTDGLKAASDATAALLSYDYRTLDGDLARADGLVTGDFAQQYRNLSDQLIKPSAGDKQVVTKTTVTGGSVVSSTPDGLVALLFLNQQTSGKDTPVPRVDRSRAQVTMTEVDGSWKLSELKPV